MCVTHWYILHSIQTCLFILELLLEHELPESMEKSLGDIAREGLFHHVSVTWRKQAHFTYAHFRVSGGRSGGGSRGGGAVSRRGTTANNRKKGEGGRGGGRSCLFRTDTKKHFVKQVLNI